MGNIAHLVNRLLHGAIAVCLSCMSTFVFANVILRYFFDYSLTWAEEASRYCFVWLIFLGAVVAARENVHLGVDTLVQKLSLKGRRILFIINNIILVLTMALCVDGTYKLTILTVDQVSASMRLPLAFVYVSGLIASVAMVAIFLRNIYLLATDKLAEKDLVMAAEEDKELVDQALGGHKGDAKP